MRGRKHLSHTVTCLSFPPLVLSGPPVESRPGAFRDMATLECVCLMRHRAHFQIMGSVHPGSLSSWLSPQLFLVSVEMMASSDTC